MNFNGSAGPTASENKGANTSVEGQGLLSDEARIVFIFVNHVVLSTAIGVFGIAANVINMCVFLKEGLNTSMNVSFFAMAISDLVSLVTLLWLNVCLNPYIDNVNSDIVFTEVQYLSAGWPHGCAARITSWITVYITAERCISILLPLKVKRIVTPKRSVAALTVIYLINILTLVPEYSTVYFDWNFYPSKNRTMLGLAFRSNRPITEGLVFTFHASLAIVSFISVILLTAILVARLNSTGKWRKSTVSNLKQNEATIARDRKTIAMVILVAIILIVCYTPTVVFSILSSTLPDFSVVGKESNVFHSAWSFAFLAHSVNASVNIFTYYKMSSKYRKNFHKLFPAIGSRQREEESRKSEEDLTAYSFSTINSTI
ncbi:neuropeptides capa receptor [Biomphalaria glabrata]|nr:neuropeptides capa receptor [Biomphalaria glabrata]